MNKIAFISAAALIAIANPAQAQLIGGGGLGGVLGGSGSGSAGSTLGGIGSLPRVDSSTIGSVSGSGEARASKKVDRRSGKVDASGSGSAQGNGSLGQTLDAPLGRTGASGNASGNAAGSGNASAQLIGTDAVRSTVGNARDRAAGAVGSTRDRASNTVQAVRSTAGNGLAASGNAAGNASGNAAGTASGGNSFLALAGSAAGNAAGSFDVQKGTTLFDMNGEKLGKVRQVVTDARGTVRELVVKVDGETATLPASAFSTDGSLLLTAMSEGQIKSVAQQQEEQAENSEEARN